MNTEDAAMRPAPDPAPAAAALDRAAAKAEMEQARQDFHRLLSRATAADLRRPSEGTRWTNQQLLFHMLFGYLVVRALLVLVHIFGLFPDVTSKTFARPLDSARTPRRPVARVPPEAGRRGEASGTSLTGLFGGGPVIAGTVLGDVRQVFWFPARDRSRSSEPAERCCASGCGGGRGRERAKGTRPVKHTPDTAPGLACQASWTVCGK